MTSFVNRNHFDKDECLDQGTLNSLVVESASSILETLLPLSLAIESVQNVTTVLNVGEDGHILRTKLAMSGKSWGKKMDARRLFTGAPPGSKLVVKNLDVSGLEFEPNEKTSLWVPSTSFDWYVNKTNNQSDGSFTTEELTEMSIGEWSLRVHVGVTAEPTNASLKWVAIPLPVNQLGSLPGDASKPGYPTIALSDGEGKMTGNAGDLLFQQLKKI